MTLLLVIVLDVGVILIISAIEDVSLQDTFTALLHGDLPTSSVSQQAATGINSGAVPAPPQGQAQPAPDATSRLGAPRASETTSNLIGRNTR